MLARSGRYLCHVRPSVRPSAYISAAPTGQISVKFDTADFYENRSIKSRFCYNLTKTSVTLRVGLSMFYCYRRHKVAVKTFLTTPCVQQQYKKKVLLHFHNKKVRRTRHRTYIDNAVYCLFSYFFLSILLYTFYSLITCLRFPNFSLPFWLLPSSILLFLLYSFLSFLFPFLFFLSIRLSKSDNNATLSTEYVFSCLKPFIV